MNLSSFAYFHIHLNIDNVYVFFLS